MSKQQSQPEGRTTHPVSTPALPDAAIATLTPIFYLLTALILALLLTGPSRANASPLDDAADNWVEDHAASEAEGILREIEGDIQLDPNLRANLKNSVKSFLKDRLKQALIPSAHSVAMQAIIDKIQDSLNSNTRRSSCDTAAVNQAYWAASQVSRTLIGAAGVVIDLLGSVTGVGSLARDLAENAVRRLAKEVANRVRRALENALDEYIRNYQVETYSNDFSTNDCSMTMRVIWNKQRGRYYYAILGNCNCNRVATRDGRSDLLERWSVTGEGGARWVGEEQEREDAGRLVPVSAIRGEPAPSTVRVKSVCCDNTGTACAVPSSSNPWIFVEPETSTRPTTGTPSTSGTTGSTGGGDSGGTEGATPEPTPPLEPTNPNSGQPLSNERGEIVVPEIPDGPLCPSDKEQIINQASQAYTRARELVDLRERDYRDAVDHNASTQVIRSAEQTLNDARSLQNEATQALDKAFQIPEREDCHPSHDSHDSQSMVLPDSSGFYVISAPAALTLDASGPQSCRAGSRCRYNLIVTNSGNSMASGAMPISISTDIAVRSVKARSKGWYCMPGQREINCYTKQLQLAPESFTGLELDLRFANRTHNAKANICFSPATIWQHGKTGPVKNRATIKLLQHALTKAGFKPGPVDGQMGRRTLRSARAYAKRNFCQIPEPIFSDDLLTSLLGGEIINGEADQACTSTHVTANRKPAKKKRSSRSNWPGVILKYGIQRELHRRHERRHKGKYKSEPKSEYKEVVPKEKYLECTPDGKCY